MLKQRVMSILVLAPIFIALVLLIPNDAFKVLLSLVLALAAYEWSKLSGVASVNYAVLYAALVVGLAYLGDHYSDYLHLSHWIYWLSVIWWLVIIIWVVLAQHRSVIGRFSNFIKLIMGFITLLPLWYALSDLHGMQGVGPKLALYLILLVWFADIGAYIAGRLMGRTKLASVISPGKTIEGVVGGMLVVLVLAYLAASYFGMDGNQLLKFVIVSVVVAAISVVGDLFESVLKRQAGVKDSGNILPGHGGVLDRIDSLTAAAPIFFVCFSLFLS